MIPWDDRLPQILMRGDVVTIGPAAWRALGLPRTVALLVVPLAQHPHTDVQATGPIDIGLVPGDIVSGLVPRPLEYRAESGGHRVDLSSDLARYGLSAQDRNVEALIECELSGGMLVFMRFPARPEWRPERKKRPLS